MSRVSIEQVRKGKTRTLIPQLALAFPFSILTCFSMVFDTPLTVCFWLAFGSTFTLRLLVTSTLLRNLGLHLAWRFCYQLSRAVHACKASTNCFANVACDLITVWKANCSLALKWLVGIALSSANCYKIASMVIYLFYYVFIYLTMQAQVIDIWKSITSGETYMKRCAHNIVP